MNSTRTNELELADEWDSPSRSDSMVIEGGIFRQMAVLDTKGRVIAARRHELVITATNGAEGFRTQVLVPLEGEVKKLTLSVSDDVNLVASDRAANAVLGRIADTGVVTVAQLEDWFDTAADWIAFSRLQRARLLADHGTEFTLSPSGNSFVDEALERAG